MVMGETGTGAAGRASAGSFAMRPARPDDEAAIVDLLAATLGWEADERHRALFGWKHSDNPFGPSPGWVAEDATGIVGSRTLMRWAFRLGGERVTAVRAVDTATHPRAQGRGVFRALTLHGIEQMTAEGVDWVFNTPNAASAPGYVKMGWRCLGHLPVSIRPAGLASLPRIATARRPAELWSTATSAGEPAGAVLADTAALAGLLGSQPDDGRLRTDRSPAYLSWRYGASPVGYRALVGGGSVGGRSVGGGSVGDGVVLFRLRRRGPALEAAVAEVLVPGGDRRLAARLCRRVLDATCPDYLIRLGAPRPRGWLPVPGGGPLLTWRPLARPDSPPIERWDLSIGDVELF